MSEKIKVGIIGTGGISHCHMDGYRMRQNDVTVEAVCDIDQEKVKAYAEKYGIEKYYTDYNEMLEKETLDAVSVTTWNSAHCAPTIAALSAGVNVLCEKPMAINSIEAMQMQEAAEKYGKLLQIGFVRRFGTDTETIKKFVDAGTLGDLYYAKVSYLRRSGSPGGWFSDIDYSGGGPLIDLGVHVMDLVRYLAGRPKAVSAYGATFRGLGNNRAKAHEAAWTVTPSEGKFKSNVEDFATGMIKFDNGFTVSVEASFNLNIKQDKGGVEIFGTKAGAVIEGAPLEIYSDMNGFFVNINPSAPKNDFTSMFRRELSHFVDCVKGTAECRAPAEDGVELMRIIDALYESARSGRAVEISH